MLIYLEPLRCPGLYPSIAVQKIILAASRLATLLPGGGPDIHNAPRFTLQLFCQDSQQNLRLPPALVSVLNAIREDLAF